MDKLREGFMLGVVFAILFIIFILSICPFLLSYTSIPGNAIVLYSVIITIITAFSVQILIAMVYIFSISKNKMSPEEIKKELDIKLKSIEWSRNEIKRRYYNREISKETFNKLLQKYEEEEIEIRREIEKLKNKITSPRQFLFLLQ